MTACTPQIPASDRVVHLDLRLADGTAPAQALAGAKVRWIERLDIEGPADDLGAWSAQYCRVDPTPDGGPGVALIGIVQEPTRMKRVELRSSSTYHASEIDFLEIDVARTLAGIARVKWTSSLDNHESQVFPRSSTAFVQTQKGVQTLRIELASLPSWVGEITELSITPKEDGMQRVDLIALRMGRAGFTPGPDPAQSAPDGLPLGSDGGMVTLGREARRAVPSDWGVPLYARANVPRGGRLSVAAGVSASTTNLALEVRFTVDARSSPAEPWRAVGGTSIVPGMRAQGSAWEQLSFPLGAFEGGEVELRFLASIPDQPSGEAPLDRARVYWAEALVHGEQPQAPRPNVLLITLGTVRADAIGMLQPAPGPSPTPFIDNLAERGILFENAWSACNAATPAHASIMTGLAVQDHGVLDNRSVLSAENTTLAESFRQAGWQTAAAVSVPHLTPENSGLGQGFDRFWLGGADSARDGAKTTSAVRDWWRAMAREGQRPVFLWLHLFDAHTPYAPPAWFLRDFCKRTGLSVPPRESTPPTLEPGRFSAKGEFLEGVTNRAWAQFMYRASVAYQDELLRQLFAELSQRGGLDNTVVALIADHGEALGEHGNDFHHAGLHREVMHVPLILALPQGPRGVRVKETVWSLDLARTLFGLSGLPPPHLRGVDLVEFARRADRERRRIFFEHSGMLQVGCVDEQRTAIRTQVDFDLFGAGRKLPAQTLQVFDVRTDAAQLQDLAATEGAGAEELRKAFDRWRAGALARESLRPTLSAEAEAHLQQLGY